MLRTTTGTLVLCAIAFLASAEVAHAQTLYRSIAAPAGSLQFAPDICIPARWAMKESFGGMVYGRYGFTDAFHPVRGWFSADVLGLDVGITLLSCENLRPGNVWSWFMRNREIPRAMKAAGM